MKSRANEWSAEQEELFKLHVAKEHLPALETWPVEYHAAVHSSYLGTHYLNSIFFLFFLRAFLP